MVQTEGGVHSPVTVVRITQTAGEEGVGVAGATAVRCLVGMNRRAYHLYVTGTGLGASIGNIEGSLDGTHWDALEAFSINATTVGEAGAVVATPWVRLSITAENAQAWKVHLLVVE